jgi:hypothetical protein
MNRPDRHRLHHRVQHWGRILIALVLLAILLDHRPVTGQTAPGAGSGQTGDLIAASELQVAIDRSARFLAGLCDEHGQFAYRVHLDPDTPPQPGYNELRHAGAIYAMGQYGRRTADPEVKRAMLRAATFLRRRCMAPVAGNPKLIAVWSEPELLGMDQPRQAKLGATGLGLVALASAEQLEPGFTTREELRALGRFLLFMQQPNGAFYSKYFPDLGRSDLWQSMYYPGEAALGLLMLHELDPAPQWMRGAQQALVAMAREGGQQDKTFPDQWFLLASEYWFRLRDENVPDQVTAEILHHARRICRDMVADQQGQLDCPMIAGCFTPDGRTCPTATRLEGLLAALMFLPPEDEALKQEIRVATRRAMRFLLRAQVADGPLAGAIPRVMPGFGQPQDASDAARAGEVRVDYVQHALSAKIQFEQVFELRIAD